MTEISRKVGKRLNNPVNEDLIRLALDQLQEHELLSTNADFVSKFNGVSRREILRRVGLGTVMALPLITSLVAPKAVNAQSTCGGSCACSVQNPINVTTGVNCRTLGGTSDCLSSTTCDCLVTASSFNGTCVGV